METPFTNAPPAQQQELLTSVWLYSTEKGRENKKRPYKYWMNNTEMFFEVYISLPVTNPDIPLLLQATYKSFIQNAMIYSYQNEFKNNAPITYIPANVFSNPMVDDIRSVTLTNYGWRIPFRCHISLPIDKVRYIKLFVQQSSVEFGIYSKASSKNKLDAGTPTLFPLIRELTMAPNNLPPIYLQIPNNQVYPSAQNNSPASNSSYNGTTTFPYENYANQPPNSVRSDEFDSLSSDDYLSGEGSDGNSVSPRKRGSLVSSNKSIGFSNLALDEKDSSSSEYDDTKPKKPKTRRTQIAENRRRASLKLRSSSENAPAIEAPMHEPSACSGNSASADDSQVTSPSDPESGTSGDNKTGDSDKSYLESRQFTLLDPMQLQPFVNKTAADFGWVLGRRTPTTEHKLSLCTVRTIDAEGSHLVYRECSDLVQSRACVEL